MPLVYDELRRLARHVLLGQLGDHTLQSTALVHEAYLRLVGHDTAHWDDRVHFFAVAAQLMRRILVDHARKQSADKRGGNQVTLTLDERLAPAKQRPLDVVALDDALDELSRMNPQHSRIIEMRFFAGLSIEEAAQALRVSPRQSSATGQLPGRGCTANWPGPLMHETTPCKRRSFRTGKRLPCTT